MLSDLAPDTPARDLAAPRTSCDSTAGEQGSWFLGDELTLSTVQVVAESVSKLTCFAVVGIAAVTDGDTVEVLAAVGSRADRSSVVGRRSPLTSWDVELQSAEDWGELRFQPSLRPTLQLAPRGVAGTRTWQAGDRLVATLRSSTGERIGFLWVEEPGDKLWPDAATCRLLEEFARLAARAVAVVVVRQDLGEHMRLLTAARAVVRRASRELEIDALMEQVCRPLAAGFRARGMWLHVFADDGSHSTLYDESDLMPLLTGEAEALARRVAEAAWAEKRIGIVSTSRLRGGLFSADEVVRVRELLDQNGLGSLLFIPMGSGPECLGSLILGRDVDESPWSEREIEVALDLGQDLGTAVLTAASFQRERDLVHRLQALDAHKTKLMRTMSHELKSPLAAIHANIEMIEENTELDEDARRGLEGAVRGTQRLARVVDDLLVLAEAGDPDRPLQVAPVDLVGLVEDAVELKRAEALGAGVVLRVERSDDRLPVLGNAFDLELLVANLVSNAVKYSPDGGTVTLHLARAGERVVLSCTDEGLGMSAEDQARIFEEFFRSRNGRARSRPGTGLGLSIVQEIVRRHGGTIEVHSALGTGSTFRVALAPAPSPPSDAANLDRPRP